MSRERLLQLLVENSYQYSEAPKFKLASGRMSSFYIDCRKTTMRREAGPLIAAAFDPHIPETAQAIGGLTMGADPIAYAVRDFSRHALDVFVVRKEAKQHGLGKRVEGPVTAGMQVVVVDDVVTSGASTIAAMQACRAERLEVVAVVVLVDRQEDGGMTSVRREAGSAPATAIFTRADLHRGWEQLGGTGSERSGAGTG